MTKLLLPGLSMVFLASTAFAADSAPAPAVDFQRDIRPLLSNRCFKCHGPAAKKGGLRLDRREDAVQRNAIVPGDTDASKLIERILAADEERMPPADAGKPLTADEIARLKAWIRQGAEYKPHWAYLPPQAVAPPSVRDHAWSIHPIDRFILARLEREGLAPSPPADKTTLIRRVSLDLLGLLPTPAEVDAFVEDQRPDAYERLVDRLLASPHYGERQGRRWLDLARYADSNGYTIDGQRSIWPYRDWVIAAFNANLPFDEFTIEQLAGDLLPGAGNSQLIATGFQRNTSFNEEGGTDPEQFRVERTVDRTNTLGAVWFGLTVGCAQCHDHKYDAISQKEYYQLYAFFNTVEEPVLRLGTPAQEERLRDLKHRLAKAAKDEIVGPPEPGADKSKPREADPIRELAKAVRDAEAAIPTTLILRASARPRSTYIHKRGDFLQKGDVVEPGVFASLPPLTPAGSAPTRLDLARWLVGARNPLTPRVVVNRMWQDYFGKGLVETENDFGMQGAPPTHPELLDWLAVEFVRQSWDMKAMHRLLVTSAAYRQASTLRADLTARDPNNKLLGRQHRLRLEGEIIRDAALSASGLLSPKIGGPGVFPPQPTEVFSFTQNQRTWVESQGADRFRRGMYTFIWRQSQHPLLTTFDGADAQTACTRRNRSNTPLQALHLANDSAFVELAAGLGKRLVTEGPADDAGRIDFAFRLCFSRTPTPTERSRLLHYLASQRRANPETSWKMLARVLLNLDEFVTRE
jgi:hypothetical protein